jgi:predicted DNA-binding transcriptional regulator AlpA
MQNQMIDPTAPEWASRLLPIPEFATIVGEHPVTVYRKIDAGIYPPIIHIGSSSRIPGWEAWERLKSLMDARSEIEAA